MKLSKRTTMLCTVLAALAARPVPAQDTNLHEKIERMQRQLEEMKRELEAQEQQKSAPPPGAASGSQAAAEPPAPAAEPAAPAGITASGVYREITDRVQLGGYGSFRFEHSGQEMPENTFTLRRLVLTADANIAPRLRGYVELEFERFRKLELEKNASFSDGEFEVEQAIEGTNHSEIALEQAWLQFDLYDWLRFRGGAILVPVGRFNLNHDDNRWDLPRRPLVDRGAPVLPSTAAWGELGVGFNGEVSLTDTVLSAYQLYVVNGVTLDSTIETIATAREGDTTRIASEVLLEPSTGSFGLDNKNAKAIAGRYAVSPTLGTEIATSFYWGRYTPDFLDSQNVYSISGDGIYTYGPFEVEGEYVFTHFGGVEEIAREFATVAIDSESALENEAVENEVEFELANLATTKQGYWLEMRYRFWPELLKDTVFGRPFQHPQLIAVARGEQVWLGGLIRELEFRDGVLTAFDKQNRYLNRVTAGLAYRPVPTVVFQLAYEYSFTNSGESLADVTSAFVPKAGEDHVGALLLGAAFGF